jgi:cellulose synthase/poly-beta-1,6-N-acetylglucosamine synthase-like glycosyltransferase
MDVLIEHRTSSIHQSSIHLYVDQERKGKPYRLNQMIHNHKSDILIIIDADIKFKDSHVLNKMISEFLIDRNVMLVSADSRPISPKTFFEHAVYSTYTSYYAARDAIRNGNTLFGCTGLCIALRKKFTQELQMPEMLTNEDDYMYFKCIKMGYSFRLAHGGFVYYRLPKTVHDYIRQQYRSTPDYVYRMFVQQFGSLIADEYEKSRSLGIYIRSMLHGFFMNPLGFIFVSLLRMYSAVLVHFSFDTYTIQRYSAMTTK